MRRAVVISPINERGQKADMELAEQLRCASTENKRIKKSLDYNRRFTEVILWNCESYF